MESADVARESSVSLGDDARFFQGYRYHAGRQRRPRRRAHRGGGGAGAQAVQCVGHYGAIQGVAHGGKRRVPFVALVPGHRAGHGHGVSGGTRGPGVRDGARARARGTSSPRQHPFLFRSSRCVAFRPSALYARRDADLSPIDRDFVTGDVRRHGGAEAGWHARHRHQQPGHGVPVGPQLSEPGARPRRGRGGAARGGTHGERRRWRVRQWRHERGGWAARGQERQGQRGEHRREHSGQPPEGLPGFPRPDPGQAAARAHRSHPRAGAGRSDTRRGRGCDVCVGARRRHPRGRIR